ncbi:MAG: hypothetical protein CL910_05260 [Deltaproteobacteria bacterium]|jgi:hypothetical protein|nr:hypothetical protein [Deltaproteobacteria bacterium]
MTGDSNQRSGRTGFERRWRFQLAPQDGARAGRGAPGGLRSPGGVGPGTFDAWKPDEENPPCDEPTDSSS